jgi:hypothetical protein
MYVYAFQTLKHNGKHYLNISILPLLRIGLESNIFSTSLPTKFVYTFLVSARSLTETERREKKYHFRFKVCKSGFTEAATAVVELLMMGGRTPETC